MSFIANSPTFVGARPTVRTSGVLAGSLPGVVSSQYAAGAPISYGTTIGGPVGYGATSTRVVEERVVGGNTVYGGNAVYGGNTVYGGVAGSYGTGLATSALVSPAPIYNKAVVEEIPTESRIEYVPYEKREIVYEQIERVEQIPVQRVITEYEEVVRT